MKMVLDYFISVSTLDGFCGGFLSIKQPFSRQAKKFGIEVFRGLAI
jgi:hypothetical protein